MLLALSTRKRRDSRALQVRDGTMQHPQRLSDCKGKLGLLGWPVIKDRSLPYDYNVTRRRLGVRWVRASSFERTSSIPALIAKARCVNKLLPAPLWSWPEVTEDAWWEGRVLRSEETVCLNSPVRSFIACQSDSCR